ncbi:MAG: ATP-binding protein, partial [Candidatus Aminicenantales bacterium]
HLNLDLRRVTGDGYELRVKDDGVGFPENLDFRKTETLGMQIVSTLVDQIDGRLSLEAQSGTRFTLQFNELPQKTRN